MASSYHTSIQHRVGEGSDMNILGHALHLLNWHRRLARASGKGHGGDVVAKGSVCV